MVLKNKVILVNVFKFLFRVSFGYRKMIIVIVVYGLFFDFLLILFFLDCNGIIIFLI